MDSLTKKCQVSLWRNALGLKLDPLTLNFSDYRFKVTHFEKILFAI
jgi:hypothetical protein